MQQHDHGVTLQWMESVGPLPIVQERPVEQRFSITAETREQAIEKARTACPSADSDVRTVAGP